MQFFVASMIEQYSIIDKSRLFGIFLIFNLAESIIPKGSFRTPIILCVSLRVFTKSNLYPDEFFVTNGNFCFKIFFEKDVIVFPIVLFSGNMIFSPFPLMKVISLTLSIVLPYFKLLLPLELFPSIPPTEQYAPTEGLGGKNFVFLLISCPTYL